MAPVVTLGADSRLVAPITLVANGSKVLGVTSAELLRPLQGTPLAVMTQLDGSAHVPIATWSAGRYTGVAIVELGGALPPNHDVVPLPIGGVCATSDTRGAPTAISMMVMGGRRFERILIPVFVDNDDGGGMSDTITRLVSPADAQHAALAVEGAPIFAWFPPDPALGRRAEILAMAIAYPYRANIAKPRATPVIAEMIGLDDLGRALISAPTPDDRPELKPIAGQIDD